LRRSPIGRDFRRPRGNLNSEFAGSAFWIRLRLDRATLGSMWGGGSLVGANLVTVEGTPPDSTAPFRWDRLMPADAPRAGSPLSATAPATGADVLHRLPRAFRSRLRTAARARLLEYGRRIDGLRTGSYYGL
jgi:hypothetical protein